MAEDRQLLWRRTLDEASQELASVALREEQLTLSGTILANEDGVPLRVDYRVDCDRTWRTREVVLAQTFRGAGARLLLQHDGDGVWRKDGRRLPALNGCSDIDLAITPSTNALPINRLSLAIGARGTINAAWVLFPSLEVRRAEQTYERLDASSYRYRDERSGFEAVLTVDDLGLPVDYAGIWRRIAAWPDPGPLSSVVPAPRPAGKGQNRIRRGPSGGPL